MSRQRPPPGPPPRTALPATPRVVKVHRQAPLFVEQDAFLFPRPPPPLPTPPHSVRHSPSVESFTPPSPSTRSFIPPSPSVHSFCTPPSPTTESFRHPHIASSSRSSFSSPLAFPSTTSLRSAVSHKPSLASLRVSGAFMSDDPFAGPLGSVSTISVATPAHTLPKKRRPLLGRLRLNSDVFTPPTSPSTPSSAASSKSLAQRLGDRIRLLSTTSARKPREAQPEADATTPTPLTPPSDYFPPMPDPKHLSIPAPKQRHLSLLSTSSKQTAYKNKPLPPTPEEPPRVTSFLGRLRTKSVTAASVHSSVSLAPRPDASFLQL